jgi:hypothetical protein
MVASKPLEIRGGNAPQGSLQRVPGRYFSPSGTGFVTKVPI